MTYTYMRSRGCRWARSHQEEVKKHKERSRDEEKDSASRPRAAEVWNDREA